MTCANKAHMNAQRYGGLYSRFHGCNTFRIEQDVYILSFAEQKFENWNVMHLHNHEHIRMDSQEPFVLALKGHLKTEDPITVCCRTGTWTALVGNNKMIVPQEDAVVSIQLYATPYFVSNPQTVVNYLDGVRQIANLVYAYENCILYLDPNDMPYPGGCYFDGSTNIAPRALYRICVLSNEPMHRALNVAVSWKAREGVHTVPFLTREALVTPKMIPFDPVPAQYLPDDSIVQSGTIQKQLSSTRPCCLLLDVLSSFLRRNDDAKVENLGLIVEWPMRVSFEYTRHETDPYHSKQYVALAVNGSHPKKTLLVCRPYEEYTEFSEVPATALWTQVYYVDTFLDLPEDVRKVTFDSVVVGYVYREQFFCFGFPVIEGRPSPKASNNTYAMLKPATSVDDEVLESFQYNHQFALQCVRKKGVPYDAWCLTPAHGNNLMRARMPKLVETWLQFFAAHYGKKAEPVDTQMVQTALTLTRHRVCFQIEIVPADGNIRSSKLSKDEIVLSLSQTEADFINSVRVGGEDEASNQGCTIC